MCDSWPISGYDPEKITENVECEIMQVRVRQGAEEPVLPYTALRLDYG